MTLCIDSRENSTLTGHVQDYCSKHFVPYEKQWLEVGDYAIGDVCFEAKSTIDFLGSVRNKRLWRQLDSMITHYKKNFLIIHGTMQGAIKEVSKHMKGFKNAPSGAKEVMLRNTFEGAIGRIRLDYNVEIIWHENVKSAAKEMVIISKMSPIERNPIDHTVYKRVSNVDDRVILLSSIKGVSVKKANTILKKYKCIMEIGSRSITDLKGIDGIGQVLAERIVKILNEENVVKL